MLIKVDKEEKYTDYLFYFNLETEYNKKTTHRDDIFHSQRIKINIRWTQIVNVGSSIGSLSLPLKLDRKQGNIHSKHL